MADADLLSEFSLFLKEIRAGGTKIIAYLAHDNIPEELIDAAGFFPLRMMFGGNDELMDASHEYLPASTCSFAQSSIGLFSLKPNLYQFLDQVDYFIVSNHCVSDICASEIISKYYDIPRIDFYVSYTKNVNSLKYFKLELLDFKNQLEELSGQKINDHDLISSMQKYNEYKIILKEINELEILGSEKLKIIQKAMLYGPRSIEELKEEIQILKKEPSNHLKNLKPILLTGCSAFIGDPLIDWIEEGGGNVVFFDTWIGNHYYSQIIDEKKINSSEDPLDLLVTRFKDNIYGDHTVTQFLGNKIAFMEDFNRKYEEKTGKKVGVINHIIKFCDHMSLMSPFLKERLQEIGIQVLNLEKDYSRANRGQLSTRIEAFLEMIKN